MAKVTVKKIQRPSDIEGVELSLTPTEAVVLLSALRCIGGPKESSVRGSVATVHDALGEAGVPYKDERVFSGSLYGEQGSKALVDKLVTDWK